MIEGKRIAVVMPAYNAEKTLERTLREIPGEVDLKILVDDGSSDQTLRVAEGSDLKVFVHDRNYGYGRNQQTCYREALAAGADVVVMVHPDYQYTPLLVTAMASMAASGVYDVVLGSRILGGGALKGGMPGVQVRGESFAYPCRELSHGRQALRISHRLPRLHPRCVARSASARELG